MRLAGYVNVLQLLVLTAVVSVGEANNNLTVRFYEFHNPLGLQCGECENGGQPACCDDNSRQENCTNTPPKTCDTRLRFELRPFGASVETARDSGFPHFTFSHGGNSEVFNEGPGGLFGLPNPFTFTMTDAWPGRIQFFIDALDGAVSSQQSEIEMIINRFAINLELQPGPNFTDRVNYTGFFNISEVNFDISFRVQCLENYYGPNCTLFCEPADDVYTCDSEGEIVCIEDNRDPTSMCSRCLPGYNPLQNCFTCILGRDIATKCAICLPGFDSSTGCTSCLSGYLLTSISQCTKENVSVTMDGPAQVATNLAAVIGIVGAIAAVVITMLLIVLVILTIIIVKLKKERKQNTTTACVVDEIAYEDVLSTSQQTTQLPAQTKPEKVNTSKHEFDNPIYEENDLVQKAFNLDGEKTSSTGIQLDVPSSYYHSVNSEESDQANVHTASHSNEQQDGKELFPYDTPADLNTTATLSSIRETTDGVMYSLAGEPLEGEVCDINVAYSVHTRSSYSSVAADGYESLSNVQ